MSIYYKIEDVLTNLKWKIQRFKRGYADVDVWSIDFWFLRNIVPMLKDLKENHVGHPFGMSDEKWCDILSEMIECFTEANEDTCTQVNEYEGTFSCKCVEIPREDVGGVEMKIEYSDDELAEKHRKRNLEIMEYRHEMQKKGLKLFVKYFNNLWD